MTETKRQYTHERERIPSPLGSPGVKNFIVAPDGERSQITPGFVLRELNYLLGIQDDLLAACQAQRDAIDLLFARIIAAAPHDADPSTYHPSKSGKPWEAFLQGKAAIAKARGQ